MPAPDAQRAAAACALALGALGGLRRRSVFAAATSEETDTIMDVYEPYLIQLGFLQRTPRGRIVTKLGRAHLGASDSSDRTLF